MLTCVKQDSGQLQMIKFKICALVTTTTNNTTRHFSAFSWFNVFRIYLFFCFDNQGDDTKTEAVRTECSSEADLFFHYAHTLDLQGTVITLSICASTKSCVNRVHSI